MKLRIFGCLLFLGACSRGAEVETLMGRWTGSVDDLQISVEVTTTFDGADGLFGGTVTTSNRSCLRSAMLLGRRTLASVDLSASGSGSTSQLTVLHFTGELEGDRIDGLLSMTGDVDASCEVVKKSLVLHRR
jgi:hypothetical protein